MCMVIFCSSILAEERLRLRLLLQWLTLKMSTLKILHRPIELSTKLIKPSYLVSFLDLVPVFLLKHLRVLGW